MFGTEPVDIGEASRRGIQMHDEFVRDLVSMVRNPLMDWMDTTPIESWGNVPRHWTSTFNITEEEFYNEFDSDSDQTDDELTRYTFPIEEIEE